MSSSESSSTNNSSSDSDSSQDIDSDDSVIDKNYVPSYDEDTDDDGGNVRTDDRLQRPNPGCSRDNDILVPPVLDSGIVDASILVSPAKKGIKRKKCPEKWKSNGRKQLRNAGKMYKLHTRGKQNRPERKMKHP